MSDPYDPIDKIEAIDRKALDGAAKVVPEEIEAKTPANRDYFDSLMSQERSKESLQVQKADEATQSTSLIDQVRDLNNKVEGWNINIQPSDLVAQAQETTKQIETIKGKLSSPNVEISGPVQRLLNRKLSHINESLKIALDKAGVESSTAAAPITTAGGNATPNPVEKLLGYLANSQHQLDTLSSEVANLQSPHKELSPANMLAIQIKVNFVSQQLELFTNLLNKALESTKTLMNVQV